MARPDCNSALTVTGRNGCLAFRWIVPFLVASIVPEHVAGVVCESPPTWLDCRGENGIITFDQQWEKLREACVAQKVASDIDGTEATIPSVSRGQLAMADTLVERWWPTYVASPRTFDHVMQRRLPATELGGYCAYGMVHALFTRAQFSHETAKDSVGALQDLEVALQMLGPRFHLDMISEASGWPFDSFDIRINRDRLLRWLNVEEGLAPAFVLSKAHAQFARPLIIRTRLWRPNLHAKIEQSTKLDGVIFGVHSALILEPMTMIRAALWPSHVTFKVFMRDCPKGNAAWEHHCVVQCQVLGDCGEPQGSRRIFVDLILMVVDVIFGNAKYYDVATYLEMLVRMYSGDVDLQRAHLYVCTAPLMCSLLRAVFDKPMLGYFGMQLHVSLDHQRDQLWLMHFKEMTRNSCLNAMAVHNFAMREQIRFATGVQLDVVRPRALYTYRKFPAWQLARVHDTRRQASPHWRRRVLFYRSSYLKVSLFLQLLDLHMTDCDYPLSLRIVSNSSDFITFSEMRRYRAAVLLPWDPALMSFFELYNLNGPSIMLPHKSWILKMEQVTGWIWSQQLGAVKLAGLDSLNGTEVGKGMISNAPSPWWDTEFSEPEHVLYWYRYSDYVLMPHVVYFQSFAELLRKLRDGPSIRRAREGMRRYNQRSLRRGLRWYREVVNWLVIGAPANDICAHGRVAAANRGERTPGIF